ncbi:MAG TPA: ATP-binding protein [Pyrinomonadaceae bacterium]|jgi:PAS domain S-box-containing protein
MSSSDSGGEHKELEESRPAAAAAPFESRVNYQELFENADDIIYTHDLEGHYASFNKAVERVAGYTQEEAVRLSFLEVIAPEYRSLAREMMMRKLRGEDVTRYELQLISKDGRRVWLEINSQLIYKDGKPVGVQGIARDITRRKHAQEAQEFLSEAGRIIASSLDYQATLSSVARMAVPNLADWCAIDLFQEDGELKRLAVAHVDPAKIEWANELQRRYPQDMNEPQGLPNVLRTGRSEIYPEISDELLVAAARDAEHLQIMREIGITSAMIVPLLAHGRTLGAITFISAESGRRYGDDDLKLAENLADRAALAIDNARLYQSVQEASRIKDEFLATLSHELRTPLTAILGWAIMLRTDSFDRETTMRALETIERNARAQTQIVEDVLDVSRIITGNLRLDIRPVEISSVIEASIETIRPTAEAKGIALKTLVDPAAETISADPARLQQVLWNLLSNAVKFTPSGGSVEVRVGRAGAQAMIEVSDTGEGISARFLPHVFDRFRQADGAITRRHGGLGLGLAIVRHLVELHGGTVRAASSGPGLGSTFTLTLPLMPARQDEENDARSNTLLTGASAPPESLPALHGLSVLVVEDEDDTREVLTTMLESRGASVLMASSAAEGLKLLLDARPHLLISDIGMPDEDGYVFIRRVRSLEMEGAGKIPAIALTAYAREEDRMHALLAGYQVHVAKPINPAELLTVVASLAGLTGRS